MRAHRSTLVTDEDVGRITAAIILLGFAGALRRSELAALALADLEPQPARSQCLASTCPSFRRPPMETVTSRKAPVEGKAERHQDKAGGRPPPANGEREALEDDRDDGQRVEGTGRQRADLRPQPVVRRHERCDRRQQRERQVPGP